MPGRDSVKVAGAVAAQVLVRGVVIEGHHIRTS